ncbi:MAG TPA: hypothetical protein VEA99_13545 [Gemmatimonadaceae bacterium]|nr:hypothetical protein [Gemmatimonadaceae bacterium]
MIAEILAVEPTPEATGPHPLAAYDEYLEIRARSRRLCAEARVLCEAAAASRALAQTQASRPDSPRCPVAQATR